jgi:hypothetical protein
MLHYYLKRFQRVSPPESLTNHRINVIFLDLFDQFFDYYFIAR